MAPAKGKAKKAPAKAPRRARAQKGTDESRNNKKAEVIAMMSRAKGVTLAEIMEATRWQKHTVRGFVTSWGARAGRRLNPGRTPPGAHILHRQIANVGRFAGSAAFGSQPGGVPALEGTGSRALGGRIVT